MDHPQTTTLAPAPAQRLQRIVGLSFGIAVIIGGTVGAGILRTPGTIAGYLGRADLIVLAWLLVGTIAALGANCYAELATAMPTAGGPFVFVRRGLGGFAGFAAAWADWLAQVCAFAYVATALGEYSADVLPLAQGHTEVIALALLFGITALNWFGVRVGATFQQGMSAAKALGLIALAVVFLVWGSAPAISATHSPHAAPTTLMGFAGAMLLAIRVITENYSGWNGVIYFSEDQREPSRNIPRSLYWGVLSVVVLYVLINVALLNALPMTTLASSKLAVADAAQVVFGGSSGRIVTVLSIISLLGILNVTAMGAPRILFGLSRTGVMPASVGCLNRAGSPGIAMLVTAGAAAVLVTTSSFDKLFGMAGFLQITLDTSVYLSFFRLRRIEPQLQRPYVAWGYPLAPRGSVTDFWGIACASGGR
jgi:APA family basic amino acid/polyamine antiporter